MGALKVDQPPVLVADLKLLGELSSSPRSVLAL
jgi:hypothetical protein